MLIAWLRQSLVLSSMSIILFVAYGVLALQLWLSKLLRGRRQTS
jgi:hypothetical protein